MPSIKLIGRRWGFGADDLVVPSLVCSVLRIIWFVMLIMITINFYKMEKSCEDEFDKNEKLRNIIVELFIIFSLIVYASIIILYFVTAIVANRGTIIQNEKRKNATCLLVMIHLCLLGEMLNSIVGTFIIADRASFPTDMFAPCSSSSIASFVDDIKEMQHEDNIVATAAYDQHLNADNIDSSQDKSLDILWSTLSDFTSLFSFGTETITRGKNDKDNNSYQSFILLCVIVVGNWADLILTMGCWGFACFFSTKLNLRQYDPEQGIALPLLSTPPSRPMESPGDVWASRCHFFYSWVKCATCNICGIGSITGAPSAFQEVAIVMANFFKGLDLVPSDIVAALFLLRAQQREDEAAAVRAIIRQRIAQEQPSRTRERRQFAGNGMFVSVSRWMWASSGVGARAQSRIHAQQARESRDARGNTGDLDPEASKLLEHASYLCPYMRNIHRWMLIAYMHKMQGCCGPCLNSKYSCCNGLRCLYYCGCADAIDADGIQKRPSIIGNSIEESNTCTDYCMLNFNPKQSNPQPNIIYASFTSYSESAVPYCISVDHEHKKVIVTIQGMLSLADAITDALMIPENLRRHAEKWGFHDDAPDGSYAHAGMLKVAAWIREDIERHQVLHKLLGVKSKPVTPRNSASSSTTLGLMASPTRGLNRSFFGKPSLEVVFEEDEEEEEEVDYDGMAKNVSPISSQGSNGNKTMNNTHTNHETNEDYDYDVDNGSYPRDRTYSMNTESLPECSGYDLELVGHSLGAGVASILSLFLRPQFRSLKCTAFSPPGCIFDWKLANHSADWISSIFVGKDFAARISLFSLVKIRGQILDVLRRAKVNKLKALIAGVFPQDVDDLLYHESEVPDTSQTRALMQRIDELASHTANDRGSTTLDQVRMYIPGRVLHLVKGETTTWGGCGPCRREKYTYVPFWVDDRSTLDEILLSTRMALDHYPNCIDNVIHDIVKEYKIKTKN